jgi:hypothetical protein
VPRHKAPFDHQGPERTRTLFSLSQRFGWICWYCNRKLTQASASIDHVIPRVCDGCDDADNLALACGFCQRAKWDLPLSEFLAWLDFVSQGDSVTCLREFTSSKAFGCYETIKESTQNE